MAPILSSTGTALSSVGQQSNQNASTNPYDTKIDNINYSIIELTSRIVQVEGKMKDLEKKNKPETSYFRTANFISHYIVLVLILLPIIQVGLTVFCIDKVFPANTFTTFYKWCLNSIGIITMIEMVAVPFYVHKLMIRIESVEGKIQ